MRNLIKYSLPLIAVVILCIAISFAWFVMNATVTSGIVITTGETKFDYTLYQYEYSSWTEKDRVTNGVRYSAYENCRFSRILPGDVSYFMIEVSPTDNLNFNARFDDITSDLDSSKLIYQDNSIYSNVNDNLFHLYDCVDNKVEVDGKTLYNIVDGRIELGDYLIENTYYSYLCDVLDSVDISTYTPSLSGTPRLMNEAFITNQFIVSNTSKFFVFALEFNEDLTLVLDDSNCYMYQTLNIGSICLSGAQTGGSE